METAIRTVDTSVRKSAWILAAIAVIEGAWVITNFYVNGMNFVAYLGFAPGKSGSVSGWIAAAVVTAIFVALSLRLPSVRANLLRPSLLKLLGLAVAISAGILEEAVFRRWTMNWIMQRGMGDVMQVLGSAVLFGVLHGVWGLVGGSIRAAFGATLATGLLGGMLAVVFLLSGRSLAPCIAAHFLINALAEPGLVLAATRGEMGSLRTTSASSIVLPNE